MRPRSAVVLYLLATAALAGDERWPASLPAFSLKDVSGFTHTADEFLAHGGVIIVTAPNLSQGDAQHAWDAAFNGVAWPAGGPCFALVQDMSQSWFRGIVLGEMKEKYNPKGQPWLLLDEQGTVRKAFGLGENETVAFAFAPGGKRLGVETGTGTKERAARLVKLLTDAAK